MLLSRSVYCAGRFPTLVSLALLLSLSFFVILTPIARRSALSFSSRKRDMSYLLNTRQQSPAVAASNVPAAVSPTAPSLPSVASVSQALSPSPPASTPAPSETPKPSASSQPQPSAAQQTVAQSSSSQATQQQEQQTAADTRTTQTQTQATSAAAIVQSDVPTTTKVTTSHTTITASGPASTPSSKASSKSPGGSGNSTPSSGSTASQQPGQTVRADSVNAATATGFWANKGAVAGTFTILVLVLLCTFVIIACKIRRPRRRLNRRQHRQSCQKPRRSKLEPMSEKQASIPTAGSINGIVANAVDDPEPGMPDLTTQIPMSVYPTLGVNYPTQQEMYQHQPYNSGYAANDDYRKSQAEEDLYDAYGGYENAPAPAQQADSHPHDSHAANHLTYAPAHPYSDPRHSSIVNQAPQVYVSHYNDDHDPYYGNVPTGHAM